VNPGFGEQGSKARDKALSVELVEENVAAFNAANHDVLEQSGDVESGEAGHGRTLSLRRKAV